MDLITACKTKKLIRNVCSQHPAHRIWHDPVRNVTGYGYDDLSSDQWEIQEPEVTITATKFWEAAGKEFDLTAAWVPTTSLKDLAKSLGLGVKS